MIKRSDVNIGKAFMKEMLDKIGFAVSDEELDRTEVGDFGLNDWRVQGSQILTLVDTSRVGFKIIALMPGQTLPEHWHEPAGEDQAKEETLRVMWGEMLLGVPEGGDVTPGGVIHAPEYTCLKGKRMGVGDQALLVPGTRHWMQGLEKGVIMFSISSAATCARDPWNDPKVVRFPKIVED